MPWVVHAHADGCGTVVFAGVVSFHSALARRFSGGPEPGIATLGSTDLRLDPASIAVCSLAVTSASRHVTGHDAQRSGLIADR